MLMDGPPVRRRRRTGAALAALLLACAAAGCSTDGPLPEPPPPTTAAAPPPSAALAEVAEDAPVQIEESEPVAPDAGPSAEADAAGSSPTAGAAVSLTGEEAAEDAGAGSKAAEDASVRIEESDPAPSAQEPAGGAEEPLSPAAQDDREGAEGPEDPGDTEDAEGGAAREGPAAPDPPKAAAAWVDPAARLYEEAADLVLRSSGFHPDLRIEFDPEAAEAEAAGRIEAFHRRSYLVEAEAGQVLRARLEAPSGVWIEVRQNYLAVPSEGGVLQTVEEELPAGGVWRVSVVSAAADTVDYRLAVEVLPAPPVVYLTFDDGPHPVHTPEVLDLLGRYGAQATFFVVGRMVQNFPELTQRIVDEGHTLANHTWNHENLTKLSRAAFDRTIARTQEVLGGRAAACLRPPYGAIDGPGREWAAAHGLDVILWDVSGADWLGFTSEEIARRVLRGARDGSVVMLHDGGGDRSRTVRALEPILEGLSERGMRFRPLCGPAGAAAG